MPSQKDHPGASKKGCGSAAKQPVFLASRSDTKTGIVLIEGDTTRRKVTTEAAWYIRRQNRCVAQIA
jgi:hypothetical protein